MPLGRALESASVSLLLNKLATQDVVDFFLKWKLDGSLLAKLKTNLLIIHAVLNHAEEMQIKDLHVKAWLEEVRVAAYDAEDLLGDIVNDSLESHNSNNNKVMNFLCNSFNASVTVKEGLDFKMKDIANTLNPVRERVESKMKKMIERLEEIAKQKDVLRLREDIGGVSSGFNRLATTPVVNESSVYGREVDKEEIIKFLKLGEENDDGVYVIPIVGMGGIGKTTLAQLVYNDETVRSHFDLKAWACVSDVFDVLRITKTLVESATRKSLSTNNLELVQDHLINLLKKRKFLIVLDDVWNEKYESWDDLQIPFTVGAPGSRIIITTRSEKFASIMGTVLPYPLKGLSENDCWSLFERIVFQHRNLDAYPNLKVIGDQIVEKCKGLPLAAKALGGLLRSTPEDEKFWNDILDSKIWVLPENNILPALRLSYHHLPANLKRCFAYCSMFPKDYKYEIEKLIMLWMAEGFVLQPEGNKTIEDVARSYFYELSSRSFFQQYTYDKSRFVMHDLIHDLAQSVSGQTFFRLEENAKNNSDSTKTRHLSYIRSNEDAFQKFEPFSKVECLRTFLPLDPLHGFNFSNLTNKVPHDMMPNLRFLRVLSFSVYFIYKLPDSIGNLKHLCYLDLSYCEIKELPESTSRLYNLQTLILVKCLSLTKLPMDMGNLCKSRHLNIKETRLEKYASGNGKID